MATLRQDSETGLFTRCSQLPDKIGQGRCRHIAGGDAADVTLDKETNILVIDATDVKISMTFDEAVEIFRELSKNSKDLPLPGVSKVKSKRAPKPGKSSKDLIKA